LLLRTSMLSLYYFKLLAPTATYTLSLHDALPIYRKGPARSRMRKCFRPVYEWRPSYGPRSKGSHRHPDNLGRRYETIDSAMPPKDRKSTRLNSSHVKISYAVFCLKKKKIKPCKV